VKLIKKPRLLEPNSVIREPEKPLKQTKTARRAFTIAIDFDGLLVRSAWPKILGAQPGAVDCIKRLHAAGHYLILWTCRCGRTLTAAKKWLARQGILHCFKQVNKNNPDRVSRFGFDSRKVSADFYFDDLAYREFNMGVLGAGGLL
jgi:hypothetical protein